VHAPSHHAHTPHPAQNKPRAQRRQRRDGARSLLADVSLEWTRRFSISARHSPRAKKYTAKKAPKAVIFFFCSIGGKFLLLLAQMQKSQNKGYFLSDEYQVKYNGQHFLSSKHAYRNKSHKKLRIKTKLIGFYQFDIQMGKFL
jgi:hypothetical protein